MDLNSKIERLENNLKPNKIPMEIVLKYKILQTEYNKVQLSDEESFELAAKEMSEEFNITLVKAREYLQKIKPSLIENLDFKMI